VPRIPLAKKLKDKVNQPHKPLWDGPESDSDNGGVTQGLIQKFLNDREKLRVLAIEGLSPKEDFNHRIHYGQMWHICEQALAGTAAEDPNMVAPHRVEWEVPLIGYCQKLASQFPMKQSEIMHWYNVCKVQFPVYIDWWRKHPQVVDRVPLLQEEEFKVPYKLPSGRIVILRGKWDAVDICGKPKDADHGIYLQENKTKGDLDAKLLRRQLTYDLQTMTYLVALSEFEYLSDFKMLGVAGNKQEATLTKMKDGPVPIKGVRYNVVRRPLAGGKGSIRQKKNQSEMEFYDELGEIIKGALGQEWGVMPDEHYFFMRWQVQITSADLQRFKTQTLNPILEELCDWYAWMITAKTPADVWDPCRHLGITTPNGTVVSNERVVSSSVHFRTPLGIYFDNDRVSPEDEYISSGDRLGLERQTVMYRELVNES
jgi:hypothetical protein